MNPQLQDKDGALVVADTYEYSDKPVRVTNFYPTGMRTEEFLQTWHGWLPALPIPLRYCGNGAYDVINGATSTFGRYVTVRLPDGGSTKCIAQIVEDIKPPKTRKGIELRWRNGRWEKYLVSKGWVIA